MSGDTPHEIGHLVAGLLGPVPRVLNGRDRDHRSEGARLTQVEESGSEAKGILPDLLL